MNNKDEQLKEDMARIETQISWQIMPMQAMFAHVRDDAARAKLEKRFETLVGLLVKRLAVERWTPPQ